MTKPEIAKDQSLVIGALGLIRHSCIVIRHFRRPQSVKLKAGLSLDFVANWDVKLKFPHKTLSWQLFDLVFQFQIEEDRQQLR